IDPEATTAALTEEDSKKEEKTETNEGDVVEGSTDVNSLSYDSAGGWDIGCSNPGTNDGMGCLLFYWGGQRNSRKGIRRSCMVGKCYGGRCVPHRYGECATA
ncbi:hypothetical protein MTO96_029325, partial [Rhipicephalus appendiculatus]